MRTVYDLDAFAFADDAACRWCGLEAESLQHLVYLCPDLDESMKTVRAPLDVARLRLLEDALAVCAEESDERRALLDEMAAIKEAARRLDLEDPAAWWLESNADKLELIRRALKRVGIVM